MLCSYDAEHSASSRELQQLAQEHLLSKKLLLEGRGLRSYVDVVSLSASKLELAGHMFVVARVRRVLRNSMTARDDGGLASLPVAGCQVRQRVELVVGGPASRTRLEVKELRMSERSSEFLDMEERRPDR